MTTFQVWEIMIKSKTYTKETATKRLMIISPLLTDDELQALVTLLGEVYN